MSPWAVMSAATDIFGKAYLIDHSPIRVRSFGPDRYDNNGAGDDIVYPENSVGTFKGSLDVQVFVNGRLISDAATGTGGCQPLLRQRRDSGGAESRFQRHGNALPADSVHQGVHVLTVNANRAVLTRPMLKNSLSTFTPEPQPRSP